MTIAIPAYGRHELTRAVRKYYEGVEKDTGIGFSIAESRKDKKTSGAEDAIARNYPLGYKFNRAIQVATDWNGSAMMVGSDCLVYNRYVSDVAEEFYMEVMGCHFFNSATGEMVFNHRFACGSGKVFSKEFLSRCLYKPYDEEAKSGLDRHPRKFLKPGERQYMHATHREPICVEIRTATQMWDWEWVLRQTGAELLSEKDTDYVFGVLGQDKLAWRNL